MFHLGYPEHLPRSNRESSHYRITLSPTDHPCSHAHSWCWIASLSSPSLTFTHPHSPYGLAPLTRKAAGLQGRIKLPTTLIILAKVRLSAGADGIELHSVRVRASSTTVGTEPLRFRVQILKIGTKPDPFRFGSSLTAKTRNLAQLNHF
jgi:hypothetical protein